MPNCDFYAQRNDHAEVLKFILNETDCQIYEKDSTPRTEVRQFYEADEILTTKDLASIKYFSTCRVAIGNSGIWTADGLDLDREQSALSTPCHVSDKA